MSEVPDAADERHADEVAGDGPERETVEAAEGWIEPVVLPGARWELAGWNPDAPFDGTLAVIAESGDAIAFRLDPVTVRDMSAALDEVHRHQVSALAGVDVDLAQAIEAGEGIEPEQDAAPAASGALTRGRVVLIVMAALVALAMLYSFLSGASSI